jgi:RNAse (barnase) inhibitor barstar
VTDDVEFVWLQRSLPWVESGFIHRLPTDVDSALDDLRRLGFRIAALNGARISSAGDFHTEAAAAFGFPSYYGRNWDAFDECFGELALNPHTAIVWTDSARLATADLKAFAEAICSLYEHAKARSSAGVQVALFIG